MNINHQNQMKPIRFKKAYERGMDKEEKEVRRIERVKAGIEALRIERIKEKEL